MGESNALIDSGVFILAFCGTLYGARYYDKRKVARCKARGSNCTLFQRRIRQELEDAETVLDANLEKSKRCFSESTYEMYINNEIERAAHRLILEEQVDVALECLEAISALKSGVVTQKTPPEISKIINERKALEASRKHVKLLTFGSKTPQKPEPPTSGGGEKRTPPVLAIRNTPERKKLTRKPKSKRQNSLVETTLSWFSSSLGVVDKTQTAL